MRKSLLLCCLLPLAAVLPPAAAQAGAGASVCVPVDVEAPLQLPAADGGRGPGCIDYHRAPATLAGAAT